MTLVLQHVFGTIRRKVEDGTWSALNDAGHQSQGIGSVSIYQNKVKLVFETPAVKVGTFRADPDETLSRVDVRMGASVALTHAYITMYQGASQVIMNPATITDTSANIWIEAWNWVEE